ncbi:MAG: hypothetical protein NZ742_03575 [Acidobacteria bacterium]|nr:hypothetical protein [Acidobacteriota bacterium]MDW7984004.1 hypothetical protein [Acidobacteriota bacterium]
MKREAFSEIRRLLGWGLLSVLLGLPMTSNILQGDGQAYYAMTEAVYSSGWPDLDRELYLKLVTHRVFFFDYTTGRWVSPVSFGLALVQAPFLFIGDQVLGRLWPVRDYGWVVFGHTPIPFERTLGIWLSGVVALAVFLWALDRLSRRILAESPALNKRDRFLFLAGSAVAAPVLSYALLSPSMPHAWEAAGAALWLWAFYRLTTETQPTGRLWGFLGFLSGWLVSVRVINATWIIGFVLWRLRPRRDWWASVRRQVVSWGWFIAGCLPWALLVLVYNRTAYGHWFRTGYEGGLFVWSLPLETALRTYARLAAYYLFHPGHGLFVWSPIALLGVIGLFRQVRRYGMDHPAAGVLTGWLTFWLSLATYKIWWGDFSIGPRFYVVMAPFLGYGLWGLLEIRSTPAWPRWLLRTGCVLAILYSGILYWTISAWAARWHFPRSMASIVPSVTHVFYEIVRIVWAYPEQFLWNLEPAPPWKRMAALALDRAGRSTAQRVHLRWTGPLQYDVRRSLLQLPLRLEGPDSILQRRGFILLQVYRYRDGRPSHPQDWIAFIQLGPIPELSRMEAVTVDFLFWGVAVHPPAGRPEFHYRWNPHYLGVRFPDRLYICGAYQRDFQTAFTLGCSTLSVVRTPLGGTFYAYRVPIGSIRDRVEVEKLDPQAVVVRMETRTLQGHRVLEPDVRVLTQPLQDLQAVLGPSLDAQYGPFRGPVVLTLITDRPVRVRHRPYAPE